MPSAREPAVACYAAIADLPAPARALFGAALFDSEAWYAASCADALPHGSRAAFVLTGQPPVLLWPMRADSGRLAALTTPYTCLWHPLAAPGASTAALTDAAAAFGRWCRRYGAVRLDALDTADPLWPPVLAGLRRAGLRPLPFNHFGNWHSPDITGWDAYLTARPGHVRAALRRRGKQLLATGAAFSVVTSGAALEAGIAAYEAVHARSWKQPEPFPRFNAALMRACAGAGTLRLGLLMRAGTPLAAQFWVAQGGCATLLKLAHAETGRALSPGTVLTGWMIRALIERDGVTALDFGRGDDPYKRAWCTTRRQRSGLILANPWHPRGAVALAKRVLRAAMNKSSLVLSFKKELLF